MAYVTLAQAKQHLNIDSSYTAEDVYITYLTEVATEVVEKHLCRCLEDLEDSSNNIPKPIQHAILLYTGELYNSREVNTYGVTASTVPLTYQYLLALYQCYGDYTSEEFEASVADEICRHLTINTAGILVIDPEYVEHCNRLHGSMGQAYRRVLNRMCENTFIDADGYVQIQTDNV